MQAAGSAASSGGVMRRARAMEGSVMAAGSKMSSRTARLPGKSERSAGEDASSPAWRFAKRRGGLGNQPAIHAHRQSGERS